MSAFGVQHLLDSTCTLTGQAAPPTCMSTKQQNAWVMLRSLQYSLTRRGQRMSMSRHSSTDCNCCLALTAQISEGAPRSSTRM